MHIIYGEAHKKYSYIKNGSYFGQEILIYLINQLQYDDFVYRGLCQKYVLRFLHGLIFSSIGPIKKEFHLMLEVLGLNFKDKDSRICISRFFKTNN